MGNRDVAEARAYHNATKHSLTSLRHDPHVLEWEIMPRPFKVYTDLAPIPLARDLVGSQRSALDAIADDGRATDADDTTIDLELLAHLLYFTAGVLKKRTYAMGETFFRAAACTGNLHHIELYLACADLPGLAAGLYHFAPHDFALRRLRAGDQRAVLVAATAGEPAVAAAPVVVIATSTYWRNAWKYRSRAYRHCFWDGGTLLANLLALAAARRLPARLVMGFVDETVNGLLDVDPRHEAAIALVALGRAAAAASSATVSATSAAAPAPLDLETLPLSEREIEYPWIATAHRAGMLESPAEVASWRRPLRSPEAAEIPGAQPIPLAASATCTTPETIESVILRRGSARRFTREPIGVAQLATILRTVTRGVPADFLAPEAQSSELYLIVNAVEGLESGGYFFDRARDALVLLRAGDFRREAGFLGLGQQLPAEAAVDLFWLSDLELVLSRLGNRGYRAAQIEAAIGGGKTYLAAYALGLGASGLTFFDDDVTAFFSPHAHGKDVLFLMAVGVPQRLPRARASR